MPVVWFRVHWASISHATVSWQSQLLSVCSRTYLLQAAEIWECSAGIHKGTVGDEYRIRKFVTCFDMLLAVRGVGKIMKSTPPRGYPGFSKNFQEWNMVRVGFAMMSWFLEDHND